MPSPTTVSFVKKFYLAVLGRGYEQSELDWWLADIDANGYSAAQVAHNLYYGAKNEDADLAQQTRMPTTPRWRCSSSTAARNT